MDPITVLQNRIEQLEAKLGLAANNSSSLESRDISVNLMNTSQNMINATADHEKLAQAMEMASELNNYMNPTPVENMQQNQMHMQEVIAAEPVMKHHCNCMRRCKQAAPVLESEPIQQVPEMQNNVDQMHAAAAEVMAESNAVSQGIQQLAETCGTAAAEASQQLAEVAEKVEQAEQKMFPKRRNGLD